LCFHSELLKNPFPQQRAISTLSEIFLQNHASSSRPQTTRKLKRGMNWLFPQAHESARPWFCRAVSLREKPDRRHLKFLG
jgi:hypothetical protein